VNLKLLVKNKSEEFALKRTEKLQNKV